MNALCFPGWLAVQAAPGRIVAAEGQTGSGVALAGEDAITDRTMRIMDSQEVIDFSFVSVAMGRRYGIIAPFPERGSR